MAMPIELCKTIANGKFFKQYHVALGATFVFIDHFNLGGTYHVLRYNDNFSKLISGQFSQVYLLVSIAVIRVVYCHKI